MASYTSDISRILLNMREDRDMTQVELAKVLNISQRAYSHYESGSRHIPLDVLVALADYFKNGFKGGEEEP